MKNIVIGIEGDVASGKTTICKELINIVPNSIFIDAGSIYRGIMQALKQCNNKNLPNDPYELMKKLQVEFKIETEQQQYILQETKYLMKKYIQRQMPKK